MTACVFGLFLSSNTIDASGVIFIFDVMALRGTVILRAFDTFYVGDAVRLAVSEFLTLVVLTDLGVSF